MTAGLVASVKARLDIVAELEGAGVELKQKGGRWWGRCPFHGGGQERTPSLKVDAERGTWWCFACNEGGDVLDALQRLRGGDFRETLRATAARIGIDRVERPRSHDRHSGHIQAPPKTPEPPCASLDAGALAQLAAWQAALPSSPAIIYLSARAIPTDIAIDTGIGYAESGEWMGKRLAGVPVLVFPLTAASGAVVSLAARRIGSSIEPRWDFLLGKPRAPFLGHALTGSGELWIVEGAVDALALRAAGVDRVVAMMGSSWATLPWNVRDIVLALDADATGTDNAAKMAHRATLLGKRVRILPPAALGGCKDVAEAWQAGTLTLYADQVPELHRDAWQERVAIMLDAGLSPAVAERATLLEK